MDRPSRSHPAPRPLPVSLVRLSLPMIAPILLVACASRVPRMPGPLGAVGKDRPDVAVLRPKAPLPDQRPAEEAVATGPLGRRIAAAAEHYLEHSLRGFRDDCSGFVMAATDRAGVPWSGSTRSMWEQAREQGLTHTRKRPHVGDLVFFDNTYDRNRNGRWDDELTHVGVVLDVDPDGTVTVAHGGTSKGRTTLLMNLHRPDERTADSGEVLNDWLRTAKSSDPKGAPHLSGELWRGFATLQAQTDDVVADVP